MNKEPGPYFHLSLDGDKVEDHFDLNLGFYKIPTMAYYGNDYPYGDMLCIIKSSAFLINLPDHITSIIEGCPDTFMTYPPPKYQGKWVSKPITIDHPQSIEFFFIVSDVSALIPNKGRQLNLVNHSWAITGFTGQRKFTHVPTCIIPIIGVEELESNGVKFGELRAEYMSMHFKQGCLSISPNNQKVLISNAIDINKFWTICISNQEPKAIVSLQWVVTRSGAGAEFIAAENLGQLLESLQDPLLSGIFRNFI